MANEARALLEAKLDPSGVARREPDQPVSHVKTDAKLAQPMNPTPQERRRLQVPRIDAAGRRDKCFDAQALRPAPQFRGSKFREQPRPKARGLIRAAIPRGET